MSYRPKVTPHSIGKDQYEQLAALEKDWDSYGAEPLTPSSLAILRNLAAVPRSNGGFQIEWHTLDWDVEIVVDPDGTPASFSMERAVRS